MTPPMKATGMKIEAKTAVVAMMGPWTSFMVASVASLADSLSLDICSSTFCTDDRNGNGQDWDKRRPPFLQKDEDDEDDQEQRFDEGIFDFVNRSIDEIRIIHDDGIIQVRRECFLSLVQDLLDFRNRI